MDAAKLPSLMEVAVGSSNKIRSKIKLSKIPALKIGNAVFEDVGVFNFDFTASPVISCYTNGGLIGKSVIREAIWQIDYRNSLLRVSDNLSKMPNLDNAEKIKIEFDQTLNPFLKLWINGKQEKFLLDFGYGGLISMTEKTGLSVKSKKRLTIAGEGSVSANGIVKEDTHVTLIETLGIGNTLLKNRVAYFSKSNNYNLLGSELAKYFIVTLNFKESEIILTPYNNTEGDFETFGFGINIDNDKVYISKIFTGLNAQNVGILLDDEIISINGKQLADLSVCKGYFEANSLMKTEKEINLQIKRGQQLMNFQISKQKPF